eukprot:6047624-Pleurochrysis_carterae.AAC.1
MTHTPDRAGNARPARDWSWTHVCRTRRVGKGSKHRRRHCDAAAVVAVAGVGGEGAESLRRGLGLGS